MNRSEQLLYDMTRTVAESNDAHALGQNPSEMHERYLRLVNAWSSAQSRIRTLEREVAAGGPPLSPAFADALTRIKQGREQVDPEQMDHRSLLAGLVNSLIIRHPNGVLRDALVNIAAVAASWADVIDKEIDREAN